MTTSLKPQQKVYDTCSKEICTVLRSYGSTTYRLQLKDGYTIIRERDQVWTEDEVRERACDFAVIWKEMR